MQKEFPRQEHSQEELRAQLPVSLRTLRLNAGLKQETVARLLHVSRPTYSYYETGDTLPSVVTLYVLGQFYDVSMESFFVPVVGLYPNKQRVREHLEKACPEEIFD